jgi:hypothetical protein
MERFPSAVRRRTVLKGMAAVSAGLLGASRSGSSVGEIATKPARVHPSVPASRPLTKSWLAKQHAAGDDGTELSDPKARFMRRGWVDAVVPGTVLTTLLNNGLIDDPYFGLNNQEIPDAGPATLLHTRTGSARHWTCRTERAAMVAASSWTCAGSTTPPMCT